MEVAQNELRSIFMSRNPPHRKFSDNLPINQATALSVLIDALGLIDTHPTIHYEWIILIISSLLVERCYSPEAANPNDVPDPLGIHRACTGTTFAAGY